MTKNIHNYRAQNLLPWLQVIFSACLIVSNIIAVKLVDIAGVQLDAGVIVFPISYIIGDILAEVYGFKIARKTIFMGFIANLIVVVFVFLGSLLPANDIWGDTKAYDKILGATPRLLIASFIAYLGGELTNAKILTLLKKITKHKFLWLRTITSTIVGQGLDTILFIIIAFTGIYSSNILISMILAQWIFKCLYEILATPITYLVINYLRPPKNNEFISREKD